PHDRAREKPNQIEVAGIKNRQGQYRQNVIHDGKGGHEDAQSRRYAIAEQREDAERERDIGGGWYRPARRGRTWIEREIDRGGGPKTPHGTARRQGKRA